MDILAIRAAIAASSELTALSEDRNNDGEIARRLTLGLPPLIRQPFLIGDGTVCDKLGASGTGPVFCYLLCQAAEAPLPANPTQEQLVIKALTWQAWRRLASGTLDIGMDGVREQMVEMAEDGSLPGFTAQMAHALLSLAEYPDLVTVNEVSAALNPDVVEGEVQ